MDVLVLIDKLDDLVHNAKAVPLTDQVRIDREEIYDILDQMRATIPEEIKQARWIVKERQEMLAEAKRECDRILGEAREQAVREASQTEIVKLAERQAGEIVDDARRQARETRLEMEDWADSILSTLEVNLDKFLPRSSGAASGCTSARRRRSSPGSPWASPRARTTTSPTRRQDTRLAVASKRDWRSYADRAVPEDVQQRILDAGRLSGSGVNRQPWLFVVVESEEAKERVAETVYAGDNIRTCAFAVAIATEGGSSRSTLAAVSRTCSSRPGTKASSRARTACRPRRPPARSASTRAAPAEHRELRLPEAPAGAGSKSPEEWSAEANRKPLDELGSTHLEGVATVAA